MNSENDDLKPHLPARLVALVAVSFLLFSIVSTFLYLNAPASEPGEAMFRIASGEPLAQTSKKLEESGFVRSGLLFRLMVQWFGDDKTFPTGTFLVPKGITTVELKSYFQTAKPVQVKLTIPEGWTTKRIASALEEKGLVSVSEFLAAVKNPTTIQKVGLPVQTLDGYLFPDTYFFPLGLSADELAIEFARNFVRRTKGLLDSPYPESLHQIMTLASIVEREYRVDEEAPIIASVFLNRIRRHTPLASCATIEYILTEIEGRPHPKRIFFVDTQIKSPYNTYLNKGLPPGPISNPGIVAIRAALQPAKTNYMFFVVDNAEKGSHRFSSTFDEHEKAKTDYILSFLSKN